MYLCGRKFELETDHKSLEYIFQPKASKPSPARIGRWQLYLQEYDFNLVYRPGSQNLENSLSRLTPRQQPPTVSATTVPIDMLTILPTTCHLEQSTQRKSDQHQQLIRNCSSFESASQKTPCTSYRVLLKPYLAKALRPQAIKSPTKMPELPLQSSRI